MKKLKYILIGILIGLCLGYMVANKYMITRTLADGANWRMVEVNNKTYLLWAKIDKQIYDMKEIDGKILEIEFK